jgi:hypothetical protein
MKNNSRALENRKYLFLFIFVMALNVSLTAVLINVSFGQSQKADFSSQPPIKVKIEEQKDCPLQITVVNVDNFALTHQTVNFNIQNIANKNVRAITVLGNSGNSGKILTTSFATKLFQINEMISSDIPIEREMIKENNLLTLSIDYVEFEDGSSWGVDTQRKSENFAGERSGRLAAIKQIREFIKTQNLEDLTNFLEQEITQIKVPMPDLNQSKEWQKGFQGGYKAVISIFKRLKEQKEKDFSARLDELEKLAK